MHTRRIPNDEEGVKIDIAPRYYGSVVSPEQEG